MVSSNYLSKKKKYLWISGKVQVLHRYLLQELVIQGVCAVELEHHVPGERVFDAAHHVFRLSLRQLHLLRGLEERAEGLELWDGCQLFCE